MTGLAVAYSQGAGVPQDFKKAFELFLEAANMGNASAQLYLGNAYYHGHGTPVNQSEGIKWVTCAALQGHPAAIQWLGK